MNFFANKTVWITGASSGIGEALAIRLSAEGAKLVLSSRRIPELERVKTACVNPGLVKILPLDLLDTGSLRDKTVEALSAFGGIDIMIHNGGVSQRSLVVNTGLAVHRRVMELDYFSYIELTACLLPHFLEKRSGHFVVTSSVMGKLGTPMRSSYAAAKHALHGYFDCLRAETAASNIKVTVLTPGYIRTHISLNAVTGDGSPLGIVGENIGKGCSPEKAAGQILKAIRAARFEAYIGKFGMERISLWLTRFAPGLVMRLAPKFAPK